MTASRKPLYLDDVEACADAIVARVGKRIVLGLPVGIGKPNTLVNALVRRAVADRSIHLTIFTALSLRRPRGRSDMEKRFLEPFAQRVFGDYPELEYVRLLERDALPANIQVNEFFLAPGAWLSNAHLQQHYVSANYTDVARDLSRRGLNVIAQLVAPPTNDNGTYSLSCNPDLTVDLLPYVNEQRAQGKPCLWVGQVHRQLPYMYGDAVRSAEEFDLLLDDRLNTPLFCPPNMPIGDVDYGIALNVSALIKDGGTLQLGIGELGDAIVYGLKLRHENTTAFRAVVESTGLLARHSQLLAEFGGVEPFTQGLYACTEMLVDGFIDLYRAGILKRRVYAHALLQTLLDEQRVGTVVNKEMLIALSQAGLVFITAHDFTALQRAGVFRDEVGYRAGRITTVAGASYTADLSDADNLDQLATYCLGSTLRNGVLSHGGFFVGPKAFYAALCDLPIAERRQFEMQRISFVNELYGDDQALRVAQRRHARFVNTTMMVTGLGAAVSDGLANGTVVSGVGGQYNFIAMAHALPDARSILCVRSTRVSKGIVSSNIVWNYAHNTIPRHLRDIVVTEYGVADLRGCADAEVVAALVEVMDARFQHEFVAQAKRNGKLSSEYVIPDRALGNTPQRLEQLLAPWRQQGLFGDLPFGSDFTDEELVIAKALKQLQAATATTMGKIRVTCKSLLSGKPSVVLQPLLQRMGLDQPSSFSQRLSQRALAWALQNVVTKQ